MTNRLSRKRRIELIICLLLAVSILFVYYQTIHHDFVNYDDELYVVENPNVKLGLTFENIVWAFTTGHGGNWHPLTWISHMFDVELYGLNPTGHHWTSLQLHLINTILLFIFFNRTTGAPWRSGLVAVLFGVHPLHVQSVAWVAERKDILSALFWILCMFAYAGYIRRPNKKRYVLLMMLFAVGLMAKPMIVTLPFVLLLLDFWPFLRLQGRPENSRLFSGKILFKRILEKAPMFILSAASCVVTFIVQKRAGAVTSIAALPLTERVSNALVSYVRYMGKMIWPVNLSVFYPQQDWPSKTIMMSGILILGISTLVILSWRKHPYFFTGWFWYLGTLIPVIGLIQVGSQAMADRYTYIPMIGLFVMISWGMADISSKRRGMKILMPVLSGAAILLLMIVAWFNTQYWQNGIILFKHAVKVTRNNSMAYCELAHALYKHEKYEASVKYFNRAIRLNPKFGIAHDNLGVVLACMGDLEAAIDHYNQALRIDPTNFHAHNNLGNALAQKGDVEQAIYHFKKALELKPGYAGGYYNLGKIFANLGKIDEAVHYYQNALHYNPNMEQALFSLSMIYACNKEIEVRNGREAIRLAGRLCKITRYEQPLALDALAAAYAEVGNYDQAIVYIRRALDLTLKHGSGESVSILKKKLRRYEQGMPCRRIEQKNYES